MSGKKGDPASAPSVSANVASVSQSSPAQTESQPRDVLFVRGTSEDGHGLSVLRFSDDQISAGELREARDGQPIMGELVSLTQRGEHERLFDVSVLARGPVAPSRDRPALHAKGPANVASDAYREGWENVFGTRDKNPKPN